jgi:hypothetical protein
MRPDWLIMAKLYLMFAMKLVPPGLVILTVYVSPFARLYGFAVLIVTQLEPLRY